MSQEYTPEQIRTAFEDQMRSVWWGDSFHAERHPKAPDEYLKAPEQMAWIGWQAADAYAATLRQQAARVDDLDAAADRLGDYLVREQAVYLSHKSLRAALEAALSAQPAERQGDGNKTMRQIMEGSAWRAALIGLCVAPKEADVSTPEKAVANVRARLARAAAPVGVPDGWTATRDNDARMWTVLSPSGDSIGIHDQAADLAAELLRQLAQDIAAPSAPQGVE